MLQLQGSPSSAPCQAVTKSRSRRVPTVNRADQKASYWLAVEHEWNRLKAMDGGGGGGSVTLTGSTLFWVSFPPTIR
jgi:hypothetical protein